MIDCNNYNLAYNELSINICIYIDLFECFLGEAADSVPKKSITCPENIGGMMICVVLNPNLSQRTLPWWLLGD